MADHSKPTLTSTYANFLAEVDARIDDLAVGLDPALTTVTNMPTGSIRWNSASSKWEKWSGTAWGDLTTTYTYPNINVTGNTTLGDATGDTVTINATAISAPNNLNFDANTLFIDATNNRVGVGTNAPGTTFDVNGVATFRSTSTFQAKPTVQITSAATNTVTDVFRVDSQSSGVPANGIGVGIEMAAETSAGNTEVGITLDAVATDVTAASEDFDFVISAMAAGAAAAEKLRLKSTGQLTLSTGGTYAVNGVDVLSATALGSSVVGSSLTSVGTIATGTWQGTVVGSTYGGTGVNNAGRTLTINTNSGTIAFSGASTVMTFPAATTTLAGLGTTQTFTGVNTFTPTARASGVASYFTVTTPADTAQTASTESIGASFTAGTRTWATGTLALQRERVFAAPTYAFAGTSTLTTAVNVDIADPVAGANATITNRYALRAGATRFTSTLLVDGAATFGNATSPIISAKIGPASAQQHTLPAVTSDTIALIGATQTFTNKTLTTPTINGASLSGTFSGNYTASGQVTFNNATAPIISAKIGPSSTQQHTLPVIASDTIALLAAVQTFTNKTLTSPTVNGGTINNASVGATTASTGSFTTLNASGDVNFTGTAAVQVPAGTTAQRPTGTTGDFRFNSTLLKFEGYNGTAWGAVGGGATGGGSDDIFVENGQTVSTNYTITSGKNAMSAGPITVSTGVTVTVPTGSNWVIV